MVFRGGKPFLFKHCQPFGGQKKQKVEVKSSLFVLFGNSYLCNCPYYHPSLFFLTNAFSDHSFFPSLSTKIFR